MRALRGSARRAARGLALVVALASALQASGAAASVIGSTIECCCGRHDRDHGCDCPDCPAAAPEAPAPFSQLRGCHARELVRAIASLPSLSPPAPPSLDAPSLAGPAPLPSPLALSDRHPPTPRPPP